MEQIPSEILEQIFLDVDAKDLLAMRLVSMKTKTFVEHNMKIWTKHNRFFEFGHKLNVSHKLVLNSSGNIFLDRYKTMFQKNKAFYDIEKNELFGRISTHPIDKEFSIEEIEPREFFPWLSCEAAIGDHVVFISKSKIEHGITCPKNHKMFLHVLSGQKIDIFEESCRIFRIMYYRQWSKISLLTPILVSHFEGKVENSAWPVVFVKTYNANCFEMGDLIDKRCIKLQKSINNGHL